MSVGWVAAGVAAVGVVSSSKNASKASDAQNQATQAASDSASQELAWAKEQQNKWDTVFGPTQDVLAEYYNTLSPDDVAAQDVQGMQQAYQQYSEQLDTQLAQRGMSDSGLSAELQSQAMYNNERGKAQARLDAPRKVAEQQAGFLGLGLGLEGAITKNIAGAYSGQTNLMGQQANTALNQSNVANQQFASSVGTAGKAIGSAVGSYFQNQPVLAPKVTDNGYTQYEGGATWG